MSISNRTAGKERYETQRLALLAASPVLAAPVTDYYLRNRGFLQRFDPERAPAFFTRAQQRALLRTDAALARDGRDYRFYLSPLDRPGPVIGCVALTNLVRGAFQSCYLSYKLDKSFLNRGLMTEAVRAAVDIAFHDLGLHRIEANIMPWNLPSLKVAEKSGFRSEGLARKYLKINGVWEDHIHMVRLNEP